MRKHGILMFAILVLMAFAPLSKIYVDEPIRIGQENEIFFVISNNGNGNLEDSNIRVFIYDLGIALASHPFDAQANDNTVARIEWTPRDIKPGNYIARVEFSNGERNLKDWEYIYLPII